jgi:hypothetical protein
LRVFATRWFARFARHESIGDEPLCEAVKRAEQGSVDANLGGYLIKQRVARPGGGRSGGYRTLIAHQRARRSVFLYGFAKNERDNIDARKLADLKTLARRFMSLTDAEIGYLLTAKEMTELDYHGREEED